MEFSFDLQRFVPVPARYGDKTVDGSIIEAYIYNPSLLQNYYSPYFDIGVFECYTYQHNLGGRGSFILYKTQHKWGGGAYIVSKRICTSGDFYTNAEENVPF